VLDLVACWLSGEARDRICLCVLLCSGSSAPFGSDQFRPADFHHTPTDGILARGQNTLLSNKVMGSRHLVSSADWMAGTVGKHSAI
jgi:hypothetical protein